VTPEITISRDKKPVEKVFEGRVIEKIPICGDIIGVL
jgi:hypothetical protein